MSLMGEKDIQSFIDSSLKDAPAYEWYAITFSQQDSFDFSSCKDQLIDSFRNTSARAAVTRQKYALALLAADLGLSPIQDEIDLTIGAQGIMSWVYGLHLIHNGFVSSLHTSSSVIDTLLSLQLEDGGWALTGAVGNADVTAMTVQALAPHRENELVQEAIDRAIDLLSRQQDEDGGYKSYGVSNPESAAQVIVALTACGIDPFTDARFIKNENTLLDFITLFVLEDGSLSHTLGASANAMATAQTYYALISHQRLMDGKGGLYEFDKTEASASVQKSHLTYKHIAAIAVGALSVLSVFVLLLLKKPNRKNLLFIVIIALLLIAVIFFTDFKSADEFYKDVTSLKENRIGTVTIRIRADKITENPLISYIPADGIILKNTSVPLSEGDTVYDILLEVCRANKIHMEKSGAEGMIYIVGINHTYEFDYGDLSGWKYYVNDVSPSVGCDQYTLKDGDRIEWHYTLELGNDIEIK